MAVMSEPTRAKIDLTVTTGCSSLNGLEFLEYLDQGGEEGREVFLNGERAPDFIEKAILFYLDHGVNQYLDKSE